MRILGLIDAYSFRLALIGTFLVPIKLSLAYIAVIPLVLGAIVSSRGDLRLISIEAVSLVAPFYLFIVVAACCSLLGLDPPGSFAALAGLAFIGAFAPCISKAAENRQWEKLALALLAGQSIAALHTVLEGVMPERLLNVFLGEVTESGQLALVIPLALGFCIYCLKQGKRLRTAGRMVLFVVLPILNLALLANLKRGPWAGVLVGSLLFFTMFKKRLIIPLLVVALAAFTFVEPLRARIDQSREHFYISGGRSEIWQIGAELSTAYPLGIGYGNSPFLREFSSRIPQNLKHFHSNLLNILVENGWIALAVFVWWLIVVIKTAVRQPLETPEGILSRSIGCAFVSWQVAGIVEYNFGDSEVLLVALLLTGILAQTARADAN